MKRLIFLIMLGIAVLMSGPFVPETMATSPTTILDYTAVPPFVGNAVTPNVLLLLDNSGSMNQSAYHFSANSGNAYGPAELEKYVAATEYGGYFVPRITIGPDDIRTLCYSYGSNRFTSGGAGAAVPPYCSGGTPWDGNFLNWLVMRRIEVAKWVMMGGKCAPRVTGNCYPGGKLSFENGSSTSGWDFSVVATPNGMSPYTGSRCFTQSGGTLYVRKTDTLTTCYPSGSNSDYDSYSLTVDISSEPQGLIQDVGIKVRFGLMEFKSGTGDGGTIQAGVGDNLTSMVNAIENTTTTTWTPLAESLYEAGRYFAQISPAFANSDFSSNVQNKDPYYFTSAWLSPAGYVPCCKSFVIIFTDGQPTQDLNIPSSIQDYAHTAAQHGTSDHCSAAAGCTSNITAGAGGPPKHSNISAAFHDNVTFKDHHDNCSAYYGGSSSDPCKFNGGHYLDDVAYWMHTTDLRPESGNIAGINEAPNSHGLTGIQNVTVYTFFAFGTGGQILKDAAMTGGFDDLDGDGKPFKDATCGTASPNPLCKEWDKDGNGIPDTYFESTNAFTMRAQLVAAITDILKRSASGTSVSILSTTEKGEGALYQAYFYPSKFEGLNQIQWLGYLQGLFLDTMGNLREDTNQNQTLDMTTDKIVKLVFDPTIGQTMVQRFDDANGDGTPDSTTPSSIVTLDQIQPLWEAGKLLALRDSSTRKIYTWVDQNNDGKVTPSEFISFDASNASLLRPYFSTTLSLPNVTVADATNVINFIRGDWITGYRDRRITVNGSLKVWKLGDIIYSTPVTVGRPKEQYDLVYTDSSYQLFMQKYINRRDVVYVGANDGMLHAFNAGTYDPNTRKFNSVSPYALGEEMWAFVPYNLLPHLRWLTQTNYAHVYYMDLKPKVVDVKIFTPDADHPGGWGTIMIVGMRFGGGGINVTDNFGSGTTTRTFQSAYFVMDVTNPEKPPVLLWSNNNANMGFTTSYPAVARVVDSSGGVKWVVAMGSGPTTYAGERITATPNLFSGADNFSHLYVFDLTDGTLLKRFDNTTSNEFLGDVISLDGNLDYGVDTFYVGSAYKSGSTWDGNMYRVMTKNDTNPANWALSTLYAATGPILEAPSAATDSFSNIWVYFGTGRFLSTADKADTSQQAMYGIKDPCWSPFDKNCTTPVVYSSLLNSSPVQVMSDGSLLTGPSNDSATTFTGLVSDVRKNFNGWVLNFPTAGERVLAKPIVFGGVVLFSTFTPTNDVCGFQGEGRLYATYFETGSAYSKSVIGTESTGEIKRSESLGQGIPSMAGLHVGTEEGVRGFIQQGTGSISEIDGEPPFKFKSGVMIWQEKQY
jgi:type IV pilus assembly protein PilY1